MRRIFTDITLMKYQDVTRVIISCYYTVYNSLGPGFLEKVYERALLVELKKRGLSVMSQYPIDVYYEDVNVGKYFADILVEGKVILEIKAATAIIEEHECQLVNYLKAIDIDVGLLLNFGPNPSFRRRIYYLK